MAGVDPPLVVLGDRLFSHQFERLPVWIVGLINVHINVGIIFFRNFKHDLNLFGCFVHITFKMRYTTNNIGAVFHGLIHHLYNFRLTRQPCLGESNNLNIDYAREQFLDSLDALEKSQLADVVDIHVRAKPQNTIRKAQTQSFGRSPKDIRSIHTNLRLGKCLYGLVQIMGLIIPP